MKRTHRFRRAGRAVIAVERFAGSKGGVGGRRYAPSFPCFPTDNAAMLASCTDDVVTCLGGGTCVRWYVM
jgi:hypothetical protein